MTEDKFIKVLVATIVCKTLVILGVLTFVLFLFVYTGQPVYFWFLFLVLLEECVPSYSYEHKHQKF